MRIEIIGIDSASHWNRKIIIDLRNVLMHVLRSASAWLMKKDKRVLRVDKKNISNEKSHRKTISEHEMAICTFASTK